jgi:acetyl-CoA carboxylase biotin carboxyl carrier protein
MSLTAAEVAEILKLLESSSFDSLDLQVGDVRLQLRRGAGNVPVPAAAPLAPAEIPAPAMAAPALRGDEVTAPLLGTFYRAPKPGAPPFVEVGTRVAADSIVAIIEVMKLMNTVRAGRPGRVTEILVADGALVEFGQPLLRLAAD